MPHTYIHTYMQTYMHTYIHTLARSFTHKHTCTDLKAPACLGLQPNPGPWPLPPASARWAVRIWKIGFGVGYPAFRSGVQGFIPSSFYQNIVRAALNLGGGAVDVIRTRVSAEDENMMLMTLLMRMKMKMINATVTTTTTAA